jgi:hypothetical protein
MNKKEQAEFDKLLQERATRLGLSLEDAQRQLARKPRYLESAESLRRERGMGSTQLLAQDEKRLERESSYPGPNCLNPSEIEHYVATAQLSPEATTHLDACVECESLLASLKPRADGFHAYIQTVERTLTPR